MRTTCIAILCFFLTACTHANISDRSIPFSAVSFTGIVQKEGIPLSLQGALSNQPEGIRLAVITSQGGLLGYGIMRPQQKQLDIVYSISPSAKQLLKKIGKHCIEYLYITAENLRMPPSSDWDIQQNTAVYHDTTLTLSFGR